jgi:GTP-binding protein EngB required for normal cell division
MEQPRYGELKQRLGTSTQDLATLAERLESRGLARRARELADKLEAERFNVVVVGEFKRGKTTLVNALLGAPVLPTAVVPLTSIVTAVVHGEAIAVEVTFRDGRTERVPVEAISSYVTERDNPRNRPGIERVTVSYPSPLVADGVFIIDSPGVGSVYAHNTDAAYEFVPESDAAIFPTSADSPHLSTGGDFLGHVRQYADRIFFVCNKIDHLTGAERTESLAFTRAVLAEAFGTEPVVYPLSARLGLEARQRGDAAGLEASGLIGFERDLQDS